MQSHVTNSREMVGAFPRKRNADNHFSLTEEILCKYNYFCQSREDNDEAIMNRLLLSLGKNYAACSRESILSKLVLSSSTSACGRLEYVFVHAAFAFLRV